MLRKSIGPFFFTVFMLLVASFIFEFNFFFLVPLEEISMKDIYFSKLQNETSVLDTNIVFIDIKAVKDRSKTANVLNKLKEYHPKCTGIDIQFPDPSPEDTEGDSLLLSYVSAADSSVVFACAYDDKKYQVVHSYFSDKKNNFKTGFIDFLSESGEGNTVHSILNKVDSAPAIRSFAYELTSVFNKNAPALKNVADLHDIPINYMPLEFRDTIKAEDLLQDSSGLFSEKIKNKIALVGDLSGEVDVHRAPDAFRREEGTIYTKMSGIYIHAVGISMLLNGKQIHQIHGKGSLFLNIAIFISFFILMFYFFEKYEYYFKLTGRLIILLSSILLLFLYVFLFNHYNTEINVAFLIFIIIFIFEMLEIYHEVISLISEKIFKRKL